MFDGHSELNLRRPTVAGCKSKPPYHDNRECKDKCRISSGENIRVLFGIALCKFFHDAINLNVKEEKQQQKLDAN